MSKPSETEISCCVQKALELHYLEPNCNCAQCVACALAEYAGLDEATAFRSMEGFGGGMGNHSQTCGAVSGGVYILSMLTSAGINNRTSKDATYACVKTLVERFEEEFGSAVCRDIRSADKAVAKKICDGFIARAVELTAELM